MGFITPDLPDVDHETWHTLPAADRMQVVTRHWVEHGFGTPSAIYLLYVFNMAAYAAGAAAVISLTPGLGGLGDIETWWTQPIVYQKLVIFTLLFEVLGLGCGSGRRSEDSCIGCGPRQFVFRPGRRKFRSPAATPAAFLTWACM